VIPVTAFGGQSVAVFGLGTSGLATCLALKAGGAKVVALDDEPKKLAAAAERGFMTADFRALDWSRIAALALSPGVPLTHPRPHQIVALARAAEVEVIGDVELYCRERHLRAPRSPFLAITGTNGKSTTTALLSHLLTSAGTENEAGGNIGTAILSLKPPRQDHAHVIECSSYQIDLAPSLDPLIGLLLNISADHLDRHGTLERYAAIKERVVCGVPAEGTAIIGVDDDWCRAIADRGEQAGRKVVRVSTKNPLPRGIHVAAGRIMCARPGTGTRELVSIEGIASLRGRHNAENAACAVGAALALGVGVQAIQLGLRTFKGLAHRMEEVARRHNVLFINDSKATNAQAAARALGSFSDIFWIAGGRPKSGGIAGLVDCFPRIRKAYLIGEAADAFAATLHGKIAYVIAQTLERAVILAARDAQASRLAQPVVLLAPACASFDQFANFEARGLRFCELVRALEDTSAKDRAQ
jgi:UDP-N-acetylmuramoylalanine--D-glutamate ligase